MFNKPTDLPVDQVRALRGRGFDNNQIVQALQRSGYSSTQIFDALNQADLVAGSPGMMQQDEYGQVPPPPMGAPIQQQQQGYPQPPAQQGAGDFGAEEVEELVEKVVEEKWATLSKDINAVISWKSDVESKLVKFESRLESLRQEYDKLHQAIIGKVGEYDKNILAVGAEIKAMEMVFAKVLPTFTENVNELSRITQTVRGADRGTIPAPSPKRI